MTENGIFRGWKMQKDLCNSVTVERLTGVTVERCNSVTVVLLTFLLLSMFIVGTVGAERNSDDSSSVTGIVVDKDTSEPIEKVNVTIYNQSTGAQEGLSRTDENGRYTLSNLSSGNYTVNIVMEYYDEFTTNISLEINQTLNLNISLVKNTDSDPVPDIDDPFPEDPLEWEDSDSDGVGDNSDAYPNDPAVSKDSDGDGYPDEWNPGYDHSSMDTKLHIDAFPKDPSRWSTENHTEPPESDKKEDAGDIITGAGGSITCLLIMVLAIIIIISILIVAGYTRLKSRKLLDHQTRERLMNYINENPGIHYRGIMAALGLPMGVLTHHLNMLEKQEYIKSYQDGPYRRFYPRDHKIDSDLLLTAPQQAILQQIKDNPGISQAHIADTLGMTKKTVYYNVGQLRDSGLVFIEKEGRETECFFAGET